MDFSCTSRELKVRCISYDFRYVYGGKFHLNFKYDEFQWKFAQCTLKTIVNLKNKGMFTVFNSNWAILKLHHIFVNTCKSYMIKRMSDNYTEVYAVDYRNLLLFWILNFKSIRQKFYQVTNFITIVNKVPHINEKLIFIENHRRI